MFIQQSSYEAIFNGFYIKNFEEMNKLADDFLLNFFSNIKIRISFSHLNNPTLFESVTLFIYSKDIVVLLSYEQNELRPNVSGKSNLISRKNSWRNAGKTNFVIDCQNYLLSLSSTYGANEIYDSSFIEKQNIKKIMDKNDVMCADHHFDSGMNEMIEKIGKNGNL